MLFSQPTSYNFFQNYNRLFWPTSFNNFQNFSSKTQFSKFFLSWQTSNSSRIFFSSYQINYLSLFFVFIYAFDRANLFFYSSYLTSCSQIQRNKLNFCKTVQNQFFVFYYFYSSCLLDFPISKLQKDVNKLQKSVLLV